MATPRPGLGAAFQDALRTFTPVVRWLIGINAVVWLVTVFGGRSVAPLVRMLWLDPASVIGGFQLWQLVTFQFLHLEVWHVFWNMYGLWLFGRWLEERWGSRWFLAFYLVCGVGGGLLHLLLALVGVPQAQAPVLGASAGLFGIFVAVATIWPHRKILLMFILPIELRFAALLFAVVTLLTAFSNNGVAAFAHLGGMLTGWLWLRHGWRVARLGPTAAPGGSRGSTASSPGLLARFRSWRRRRRRKRFAVVEKEWEDWLREELDGDETRH